MTNPIDLQVALRRGFSKRLIERMRQLGYTSNKSISGVSANALVENLGCCLAMARRYIGGQSLPENKSLEKIANWLKCDSWWLLYGSKTKEPILEVFDRELMQYILNKILKELIKKRQVDFKIESFTTEIVNIYENLSLLSGPKESKYRSADLMIDLIRSKHNL